MQLLQKYVLRVEAVEFVGVRLRHDHLGTEASHVAVQEPFEEQCLGCSAADDDDGQALEAAVLGGVVALVPLEFRCQRLVPLPAVQFHVGGSELQVLGEAQHVDKAERALSENRATLQLFYISSRSCSKTSSTRLQ